MESTRSVVWNHGNAVYGINPKVDTRAPRDKATRAPRDDMRLRLMIHAYSVIRIHAYCVMICACG